MASKKQHEAFNKRVIKAITELGATNGNSSLYQYSINTKYGELGVALSTLYPSPVFSIFTMFKNPPPEVTDANPYSGKWNFHDWSDKECLNKFITRLKQIL